MKTYCVLEALIIDLHTSSNLITSQLFRIEVIIPILQIRIWKLREEKSPI